MSDAKHSRVFVGMERLLCSPDELVEIGLKLVPSDEMAYLGSVPSSTSC